MILLRTVPGAVLDSAMVHMASTRSSRRVTARIRPTAQTLAHDAKLALRNVIRHRRRSSLGLISIAAGVVALILAGGFVDWIYWSMREDTIGSRLGHMQIVRAGYFQKGAANPYAYLLPADPALRKRIAHLPGVLAVAPRLGFSGLISHGNSTIAFLGEGIDPELEKPFDRFVTMVAGDRLSGADPGGIIVGAGLARNLGVHPGDRVVLVTNRRSGGINGVEVSVRGLFATASKAYDDSALRVPIGVAQSLLGTSGAHAWVVILDDTRSTDIVADQVRRIVSPAGLEVVPWYRLADFYTKTVALFSKQVGVLKLIIATIIVLSISNTFMMSILERTSEIGTMMALGASRVVILRRFLTEGAVLGIVGGVIGVLAGAGLAMIVSTIGIPMPAPPGMDHGYVGRVRLSVPLVSDALALAVVTTLIASCYPAWRASRLNIVDALRRNR